MNLLHSSKNSVNKSINKHALPRIDISWTHFDPKIGRKINLPVNSVSKSFTLCKTMDHLDYKCEKTRENKLLTPPSTAQYTAVQSTTAHHSPIQPSKDQYSPVEPSSAQFSSVQPSRAQYSTAQSTTAHHHQYR